MKYCLLISLLLLGCGNTKLIITHPTIRTHLKGRDDNINGAAVTVRVKWDIVKK